MNESLSPAEYRCPGEHYAISRAVHLARLAGHYDACRECPYRGDTAGLSARQIRRLAEIEAQPRESPLFATGGIRNAAINDVTPQLARTIAAEFARGLQSSGHAERAGYPSVLFAGDGRLSTAAIVAAVAEGIRWTGCEAVDLGAASAPCMAQAVERVADENPLAGGIYVGNPGGAAHTLGMKFWTGGEPLSQGRAIDELSAAVRRAGCHALDRPSRAFGPLRRTGHLRSGSAAEYYLSELRPAYHALRPLRFVLKCGCGPVVSYLDDLLQNVACRVIPAEPGGDFGGQVVAAKAHFGMVITDDGENGRVYDEQGNTVAVERLAGALAGETSAGNLVGRCSQDSLVPPYGAAGRALASDALRTLTFLLVFLSRDDMLLSAVLDGAGGTR